MNVGQCDVELFFSGMRLTSSGEIVVFHETCIYCVLVK